jgi:hypothetical protein
MVPALQASRKEMQLSLVQLDLRRAQFLVVPGFSLGGEAGNTGLFQKPLPVKEPFLPKPAFGGRSDALKKHEGGGQHLGGLYRTPTECASIVRSKQASLLIGRAGRAQATAERKRRGCALISRDWTG